MYKSLGRDSDPVPESNLIFHTFHLLQCSPALHELYTRSSEEVMTNEGLWRSLIGDNEMLKGVSKQWQTRGWY